MEQARARGADGDAVTSLISPVGEMLDEEDAQASVRFFVSLEHRSLADNHMADPKHADGKTSHKEVLSMKGEPRPIRQEPEPSMEELQSLNEQLAAVNSQLQKKIEDLKATTNDLANLLASTDQATLFLDQAMRIRWFNPAMCRLIPLGASDRNRPIGDFSHRPAVRGLLEGARQVAQTAAASESELRDEAGRWYIRRILPYRTSDDQIDGVVVSFIDIAARKQAEQDTRRLAAVVRDSNDAITLHDLEGRIQAWNHGAERIYGYCEADALKMNIRQLIPPSLLPQALGYLDRLAAGHAVESFESQRVTRDGRILDIWLTVTPLMDESGRLILAATTERDISDRKRTTRSLMETKEKLEQNVSLHIEEAAKANQALRASEQWINMAVQATGLALWERDISTGKMTVNDTWFRMFGYEPGELEPTIQLWQSLLHPEDADRVLKTMNDHIAGLTPHYHIEKRVRTKQGDWLWIESTGKAVEYDARGQARRLIGTHRDISELKRQQQQVQAYQSDLQSLHRQMLETQEQERRNLAVHLHNGLSQTLVLVRMKLRTLDDGRKPGKHKVTFQEISTLLEDAQKTVGTLTVELSPPVLHELGFTPAIDWLIEYLQRRYDLHVKFDCPDQTFDLDPQKGITLFRCVQELLTNVAKHAKTQEARIDMKCEGDELHLSVIDAGQGFKINDQMDIHPDSDGGGFGLFSIREQVRFLKGSLKIESVPGKGTTVTLTVPLIHSAPPPQGKDKS